MPDKPQKQTKKKSRRRPPVSHTKGYYRFSKDYPGETDAKGFRDNENVREKPLEARGRLLLYFGLILCFVAAFVLTSVALRLSDRVPETTTAPPTTQEEDSGF